MKKERLKIIECIPYKDFKDKIRITKKLDGKGMVQINPGWIYFERWSKSNEQIIQ